MMRGTPETIGARIVRARLQLAASRGSVVTQAEIARAVGVAPGTVSQWESGATTPALDTIPQLAAALSVSAGYLAFGEGEAPAPGETFGLQRSPSRTVAEELTELAPAAKRAVGGKKRGKG